MSRYNRKSFKIVTPAAAYLTDLTDLKAYLRIEGTDEDTILMNCIKAASIAIDRYCNRFFINTTIELTLDGFGECPREPLQAGYFVGHKATFLGMASEIDLPFRPISSITSIKTFDTDNTESTYSAANYQLDETGGRVYLNDGAVWPTELRNREAVKIRYVAGYGADSTAVPFDVRQAALQHAAKLYECREGCGLSDSCKALLAPYALLDRLGW